MKTYLRQTYYTNSNGEIKNYYPLNSYRDIINISNTYKDIGIFYLGVNISPFINFETNIENIDVEIFKKFNAIHKLLNDIDYLPGSGLTLKFNYSNKQKLLGILQGIKIENGIFSYIFFKEKYSYGYPDTKIFTTSELKKSSRYTIIPPYKTIFYSKFSDTIFLNTLNRNIKFDVEIITKKFYSLEISGYSLFYDYEMYKLINSQYTTSNYHALYSF